MVTSDAYLKSLDKRIEAVTNEAVKKAMASMPVAGTPTSGNGSASKTFSIMPFDKAESGSELPANIWKQFKGAKEYFAALHRQPTEIARAWKKILFLIL